MSALSLGVNGACGVNEWPIAGGTEVFAHAGTAARLGIGAALLAREGFVASETALDGSAGLLAGVDRAAHAQAVAEGLGEAHEITLVHFKPFPACNHVQTPCQLLAALAGGRRFRPGEVSAVRMATNPFAIAYPGCAHAGPFEHVLQAKMSIPYALAAMLADGGLDDAQFRDVRRPDLELLARTVSLAPDPGFTASFPARQGCALEIVLADGSALRGRVENLEKPGPDAVRARWRRRAVRAIGDASAAAFEREVDTLASLPAVAAMVERLAADPSPTG